MSKKSQTLSIYLLKDNNTFESYIKSNENYQDVTSSNLKFPTGSRFYLKNEQPQDIWWSDYCGVDDKRQQLTQSGLAFVPFIDETENTHTFLLSFGYAYHDIKDDAYESDFGLIVTLNAIDVKKLNSIDSVSLLNYKKERIQSPDYTEMTFFDIEQDSTLIKTLVGIPKEEYISLISHITGANNVRVRNKLSASEINELLEKLWILYNSKDFEKEFPEIQNIKHVKDIAIISKLNAKLVLELNNSNNEIKISWPDIFSVSNSYSYKIICNRKSRIFADSIFSNDVYQFLKDKKITLDIDLFNKTTITKTDNDSEEKTKKTLLDCICFSCRLTKDEEYHLYDGQWYKVNIDYMNQLNTFIKCAILNNFSNLPDLPSSIKRLEDSYNKYCANNKDIFLADKHCLQYGYSKIEACDLIDFSEKGKIYLIHNKLNTSSSTLSHLFNQGYVSAELLINDDNSIEKFKNVLIDKKIPNSLIARLDDKNFSVIYGIISSKVDHTKPASIQKDYLPLFSKIALRKAIKDLKKIGIDGKVYFIKG